MCQALATMSELSHEHFSEGDQKSAVVRRSIVIAGHKTSVSLEEPFWKALKEVAALRNMPLSNLVASVDVEREHANLSSAIRLFVLEYCRTLFGGQTAARDVSRDEAVVRPVNCA
jgi:predicted DNA-binding ribbon-helix-helix protein